MRLILIRETMLQPITDQNAKNALDLLVEGFPNKDRRFWETALSRLAAFPGNKHAEVPIGYLAGPEAEPFGIILTPAGTTTNADGKQKRVVNLSSWYVREPQRWRAPMMLQNILKLEDAVFTDLTPTPPVQKMLLALGFEPINEGMSINLLPFARLQSPARAQVIDHSDVNGSSHASPLQDLKRFAPFDCLVTMLEAPSADVPLVFKRVHVRGMPAAMLIYAEQNEAVYNNIPAIARFLARKGLYLLMLDIPLNRQIPGIRRKKRGKKFAKGLKPNGRTDFLATELGLFNW